MDEHRDIYQQPQKSAGGQDLPAVEPSPAQVRAELRRKAVLFSLVVVVFGIFAVLFALNEMERKSGRQDLRDVLKTPAPAPAPGPRATPRALTGPDEVQRTVAGFTNRPAAAEISPRQMAEAMAEIRAANQYLAARDWDRADAHLTNALAICPEMNLALRLRGLVFTQRGQFDEAIAVLEHAISKDPFNAESFNTLATAYLQKKQFDRAEELLRTALDIRPDYAATQVNLGLLYLLLKKYDLAIEQLEAAAPRMPDNAAVLNNIGVCYIRLHRYEDARQKLLALIQREPRRAAAYFNVAMSYALQNDVTNAISWIKQGAAQCTPVDVQRFLPDQDFDPLRDKPEFQAMVRELYPQLPAGPRS